MKKYWLAALVLLSALAAAAPAQTRRPPKSVTVPKAAPAQSQRTTNLAPPQTPPPSPTPKGPLRSNSPGAARPAGRGTS